MQKISQQVWYDSSEAIGFKYPFYEETISQIVSLEFNRSHRPEAGILKAPNEGTNGADWLWFLHDNVSNNYLIIAAQAKRLYPDSTYYAFNPNQIDRITNYADTNNLIPLHIFYNHDALIPTWSNNMYVKRNLQSHMRYKGPPLLHRPFNIPSDFGCTYLNTAAVRAIVTRYNANRWDEKFKKFQVPWWKIVCKCGLSKSKSPLEALAKILQSPGPLIYDIPNLDFPEPKMPSNDNQTVLSWLKDDKEVSPEQLLQSILPEFDNEVFAPDVIFKTKILMNEMVEEMETEND